MQPFATLPHKTVNPLNTFDENNTRTLNSLDSPKIPFALQNSSRDDLFCTTPGLTMHESRTHHTLQKAQQYNVVSSTLRHDVKHTSNIPSYIRDSWGKLVLVRNLLEAKGNPAKRERENPRRYIPQNITSLHLPYLTSSSSAQTTLAQYQHHN
jgi:hypothetical protein